MVGKMIKATNILPISVRHILALNDIFHADSLISLKFPMVRLIKCQTVLSVKCSTTYIGESLRAFRSTLQIGHTTSVQKKTDEKKPKAVHAGKNLAPSLSVSFASSLCSPRQARGMRSSFSDSR